MILTPIDPDYAHTVEFAWNRERIIIIIFLGNDQGIGVDLHSFR